jgi:DNA-directed RNA polymerase specialized sigma24 family protein
MMRDLQRLRAQLVRGLVRSGATDEDAEDAFQEAFCRLLRSGTVPENLRDYLRISARHCLADEKRKQQSRSPRAPAALALGLRAPAREHGEELDGELLVILAAAVGAAEEKVRPRWRTLSSTLCELLRLAQSDEVGRRSAVAHQKTHRLRERCVLAAHRVLEPEDAARVGAVLAALTTRNWDYPSPVEVRPPGCRWVPRRPAHL